jgi:hypothetical protein
VKRDRQLDDSQRRSQVPATIGDDLEDALTDFVAELMERFSRQTLEVVGVGNTVEDS